VRSDSQGLAHCELSTTQGGQFRITAITSDTAGRHNASRITRWVSGGQRPPADNVELEELQFIPDRELYAPGETARILVQAPFADGYGLLTLGRHGVLEQRQFRLEGSSHTLEIPIKSEWLPNVEVSVMVVGSSPRDGSDGAAPRPAQAVGSLMLKLSTAERRLNVDVQPVQAALAPGTETSVELTVLDAAQRPVANAEVTLVVVDEAILALGGYELSNPMDLFYSLRDAGLRAYHLRPTLRLASDASAALDESPTEPMMVAEAAPMMMRSMAAPGAPPPPPPAPAPTAGGGGESSPIAIRSDFNPLAAFVPALTTDARGRVTAEFKLPDNLTRYRIMAVAVSGSSHFGIGESQLTARLPLMLRPSPPRFLNFGDRFEFPVVLQNQTDAPLSVQLAFPDGRRGGGHCALSDRRRHQRICRRRQRAIAGVDTGDDRGLRHLRRDRQRRHRAADCAARRGVAAVRRACRHHHVHGAAIADRCLSLSASVPVRVQRAIGFTRDRHHGAARSAAGLRGGGPGHARGNQDFGVV
jgi:hypothetical protein